MANWQTMSKIKCILLVVVGIIGVYGQGYGEECDVIDEMMGLQVKLMAMCEWGLHDCSDVNLYLEVEELIEKQRSLAVEEMGKVDVSNLFEFQLLEMVKLGKMNEEVKKPGQYMMSYPKGEGRGGLSYEGLMYSMVIYDREKGQYFFCCPNAIGGLRNLERFCDHVVEEGEFEMKLQRVIEGEEGVCGEVGEIWEGLVERRNEILRESRRYISEMARVVNAGVRVRPSIYCRMMEYLTGKRATEVKLKDRDELNEYWGLSFYERDFKCK